MIVGINCSIFLQDLLAASLSVGFVIVIAIVRIFDVNFCAGEVPIYVVSILALNEQVMRSKVWHWLFGYGVDDA